MTNETAKRIVRDEIKAGANTLISTIVEMDGENGGMTFWEQVENLWEEDYEEQKEVFQWWIVSDWMFDKLGEIDAVRAEFAGLYLWGRTELGQALEADYDIRKVAKMIDGEE